MEKNQPLWQQSKTMPKRGHDKMTKLDEDFWMEWVSNIFANRKSPAEIEAWELEQAAKSLTDRIALMKQWGVPQMHLDTITHVTPHQTHALETVRAFLSASNWSLILGGGLGSGKSTAASYMLFRISKDLRPVTHRQPIKRWVSAPILAAMSSYSNDIPNLIQASALVIDDLGVEAIERSGRFLTMLTAVIDGRYTNRRKTLITTNLTEDEVRQRYGDRIWVRLTDGGSYSALRTENFR